MDDKMFPVVVQALAGDDYIVYAYMLDGFIRKVDMKPFIAKGGVFERLRDDTFFRNNITALNDTVAWDLSGCYDPTNCIDIDPFFVDSCESVKDPLEKV